MDAYVNSLPRSFPKSNISKYPNQKTHWISQSDTSKLIEESKIQNEIMRLTRKRRAYMLLDGNVKSICKEIQEYFLSKGISDFRDLTSWDIVDTIPETRVYLIRFKPYCKIEKFGNIIYRTLIKEKNQYDSVIIDLDDPTFMIKSFCKGEEIILEKPISVTDIIFGFAMEDFPILRLWSRNGQVFLSSDNKIQALNSIAMSGRSYWTMIKEIHFESMLDLSKIRVSNVYFLQFQHPELTFNCLDKCFAMNGVLTIDAPNFPYPERYTDIEDLNTVLGFTDPQQYSYRVGTPVTILTTDGGVKHIIPETYAWRSYLIGNSGRTAKEHFQRRYFEIMNARFLETDVLLRIFPFETKLGYPESIKERLQFLSEIFFRFIPHFHRQNYEHYWGLESPLRKLSSTLENSDFSDSFSKAMKKRDPVIYDILNSDNDYFVKTAYKNSEISPEILYYIHQFASNYNMTEK